MLAKIKIFVKKYQADIILVIGVILISLLSFALGYVVAKEEEKEPLRFEEITYAKSESGHYWSRNLRVISGLEIN